MTAAPARAGAAPLADAAGPLLPCGAADSRDCSGKCLLRFRMAASLRGLFAACANHRREQADAARKRGGT